MIRYYTGLVSTDYLRYQAPPYSGRGWSCELVETDVSRKHYGDSGPGLEVVVTARGEEQAQNACDLVVAAHALLSGHEPAVFRSMVRFSPSWEDNVAEGLNDAPIAACCVLGFPDACRLAARLSQRRAYQHAAQKYLFSLRAWVTDWIDMHPHYWERASSVTCLARCHVDYAYAVASAYSVLEELSLEIRASAKQPSMMNGVWNPPVLDDLERRLKQAGIDIDDLFLWQMRDTPTKIERSRKPRTLEKAPWSNMIVRDSWIRVVDAIHYASWLRSRLSAHRLSDLSCKLDYCLVDNVQKLARRLLLEKFGFW